MPRRSLWLVVASVLALVAVTGAMLAVPGAGSAAPPSALPTLRSPTFAGANVRGPAAVFFAPIKAPGGPYLYDRQGRVVFFHGVDAVYKYPPYELYPDPKKPWNFSTADASLMARLGFNVVRLGMTWSGLEPGTAPANDPAIYGRGAPTNPHQFNQAHFDRYVNRLRQTVDLLDASTSTRSSTCTRTSTTRCSTAREPRSGPSARTACRAWIRRAAGR